MPPISQNLTIDGGATGRIVIDGHGEWRAFFVNSGTVDIRNLTIRNVRAKGGDGGVSGGGGGAGVGAGLFINREEADVTLTNVAFVNAAAEGGKGGAGSTGTELGGGGGGLGGNGGAGAMLAGGGGGGVLAAGNNADPGYGGAGGIGSGGGGGGVMGGGAGEAAYPDGETQGSAGGSGGIPYGGNGGFGGGGGGAAGANSYGGSGDFGSGGGGGGFGGDGGAGGGGGGGFGANPGGIGTLFQDTTVGGGNGGAAPTGGGGGGGAAAGPAVFVRFGTLRTVNSTSIGHSATAGDGGLGAAVGDIVAGGDLPAGRNGTAGVADSTPVFSNSGKVNSTSVTAGPIPDALPAPAYGLTVAVTGPGSVTSDPAGISCPGSCAASFTGATSVTLTAMPVGTASFTGWTGDCTMVGDRRRADQRQHSPRSLASNQIVIEMYGSRTCAATFTAGGTPSPMPPAPLAPAPPFVSAPPPPLLNAATAGTGSGSFSLASSFSNPSSLSFTATQSGGAPLPGWLTFTPSTVSFNYTAPIPPDLPFQPLAGADRRAGRAGSGAAWANTIYPLLLRVARIPVTLTATGGGQSYTSVIQMDFYAPRPPVAISAVSLSLDGAVGNGRSGRSALSWDGGQMVFETGATNLFPASPNAQVDIVRYQALSGDRDRLSQTAIPGGGVANAADGASSSPAMSADGRYAAFASDAPGITLVPTGRARQVYRAGLGYPRVPLNERATPAPDLVSSTAAGVPGNGLSDNPALSQDGRYVTFESGATNFATGLDGTPQVWRKDLQTGALEPVSNGPGRNPSISWDGRHVAFERDGRILLRDMASAAIVQVATGTRPRLTARADRIAFVAAVGGVSQIMAVDLPGGTVRALTEGNSASDQPAISADGRFVAFRSAASNLVTGYAGNDLPQIFVRDIDRGVTALVTQAASGVPGTGASWNPEISGDGGTLSFGSDARDLVNGNPSPGQAYLAANPLPLPEKTGYWTMAGIGGGQGWAMERWGARAYVGGLAYDADGRSRWLAGICTQSALTCSGTLAGGPAFVIETAETGNSATLVIGGAAGQRLVPFPIGGTRTTGYAGLPQSGWWYDPAGGDGVGYFLAIDSQPQPDGSIAQSAYLSVLGYDALGARVWQSSQAVLAADLSFAGVLMQYAGGAPFGVTTTALPASASVVGQVRMTFDGTDRARITLPNGRSADLVRFQF